MTDILTLVCTTVLIFIVQQVCLSCWNSIKAHRKEERKRRNDAPLALLFSFLACRRSTFVKLRTLGIIIHFPRLFVNIKTLFILSFSLAEQERVEPAQNAAFACFCVHRRYNTTRFIASSSLKIFAKDAILGARQF